MPPAPKLRERLAGPLAATYGNLPKLQLPGEDNPIHHFCRELAELLKDTGIYRRDSIIHVPNASKRRLDILSPAAFRSFSSHNVWTFKYKHDKDGEKFDVGKSITKDEAQAVLESWDFFPAIPEIETIIPVPMPRIDETGSMTFTKPGYDPASKSYTFPPD